MPKATIWNIYTADGSYLGQAVAFAAHTAFCRLMAVLGTPIDESEIKFVARDGDSGHIIYCSQEFVLSPQPKTA